MQYVQVCNVGEPTLSVIACAACAAELLSYPSPPLQRYPNGTDLPFLACGICRLALCDDDNGTVIRFAAEDVAGETTVAGCYFACRDCVDYYRPRIAARLNKPLEETNGFCLL